MSIILDYVASDGWPKYQVLEDESKHAPVCQGCGAQMFVRLVEYSDVAFYELCCAPCDAIVAGANDLTNLLQMFSEIE